MRLREVASTVAYGGAKSIANHDDVSSCYELSNFEGFDARLNTHVPLLGA